MIKPKNIKHLKMALGAIFCLFIFHSPAQDTTYFKFDQGLKFKNQLGGDLTRPFCGGVRSPMFSELDADNDGVHDIFVFDRFDKSVSVFLYKNGSYKYAPEFDYYFPPLTGWVLLRDYNCDGKNDIFAKNFNGVQVWENTSTGDRPNFTLITNSLTGVDGPISVLSGDIPAIDDIDGDGDMDILTFGASSTYVTYYRNNGTGCDLDFSIYTQCWGHFAESGLSSDITINDDCGGNKPAPSNNQDAKKTMHAGSTLATFDYDDDGDKDLLVGDISSNNLKLLINGGDANDALIDSVIDAYPVVNPIDIFVYSAGYFVDVDHDGDDDLIASTGEIALNGGANYNNTWYYENVADNSSPNHQFVQNNFLSDSAVDIGGGAIPHFYDFDHDNDMDLLLASFVEKTDPFNLTAKLYLYENIGDSSEAIFQLLDNDFAGFGDSLFFGLNPSTGDLDADGDIDLLLGVNDGFLIYLENTATPGDFPIFEEPVYQYGGIDPGFAAAPFLVDLDRDNDLDLLLGEGNGNVNYYENIGDSSAANFNIVTDSFGMISMQNPQFPTGYGYSTPYITQLDSNDNYDLVVGSWDGLLRVFMNIENYGVEDVIPSATPTYFNLEGEVYTDLDFSTRTAPALTDLDGDKLNDMIIGVFRGGIHYLKNNSDTALTPNKVSTVELANVRVYPNPNNGAFIVVSESKLDNLILFDAIGKQVYKKLNLNAKKINISNQFLSKGIYTLMISDMAGNQSIKKIVIK